MKTLAATTLALVLAVPLRGEEKPALDRYGDPLPPHAVARLGTLRFRGLNGILQAAAPTADGKQILGLGSEPTVILWDATTGKEVRCFRRPARKGKENFAGIALSPDGKSLAVATTGSSQEDRPLLLFDFATGRLLAELPALHKGDGFEYPHLAFVTSTLLVSGGHHGPVRVWDVSRQREVCRLPIPERSHVSALVPAPDGKRVFVAGCDDNTAFWTAWEATTGKLIHREQDRAGVYPKLAVSPDGASLALVMGMGRSAQKPGCTQMRLYSVSSWKERRRWQAHQGDDTDRCSITFSPDGKTIATGGADGKVRRWVAATGKEIVPVIDPVLQDCQNVAYLNDATLMTFGCQKTVKLWDAITGQPKRVFPGSELVLKVLAYAPDGRHVAAGGGDAPTRVWEAAGGKQVAQLRDGGSEVTCLCFSPDGRWLVSGDAKGRARLWDWARGGSSSKTLFHPGAIFHVVAFSPDGKCLATGDAAGIVRVWTVSTGTLVHTIRNHDFQAFNLAFSADGQALFGSTHEGIHHWRLATGKEVHFIRRESLGHSNAVSGLAFSPGGHWGYSSSFDGSISVWEADSGQLVRILREKEPDYNNTVPLALSPDGAHLAVAFRSDLKTCSVHLWDLPSGKKVTLTGHRGPVNRLAFSPNGRRLASASWDTTALVWDVSRLQLRGKVPDDAALAGLWKDLGTGDPKVVYAAVCRAAAAGDAAVLRLKRDLQPAAVIDPKTVAARVRQLDSDDFPQREMASRALAELGPAVEAALRAELEKAGSLELRQRLERALKGCEAENRRLAHALEVLEMIGTPAARSLLGDLAKGAGSARLTRAARETLARLQLR